MKDIVDDDGGEVDAKDKNGQTPLHLAASLGKERIVQFLIPLVKDKNAKDKTKKTPLHLAASLGKDKAVEVLLKSVQPDVEDINKQTPLHLAAGKSAGKTAGRVVTLLLGKMTKKDVKDKNGRTALHICAAAGQDEVVTKLLDDAVMKGQVHAQDADGWTALHHAIFNKNKKAAELLVAGGANVNVKFKEDALLHLVAREWPVQCLQLLVDLKPPGDRALAFDVLGKEKRTALYIAAHKNRADVAGLLARAGADKEASNDAGQTLLYQAADKGDKTAVTVLYNLGANKEAPAKNRMRPLHAAAIKGNMAVVEFLAQNSATLNEKDDAGWTPLGRAVINGHEGTSKYLLGRGADRDLSDENKQTLLHRIAKGQNKKAAEILLNLKAGMEAMDSNNQTPLHIAAVSGNEEVVSVLLSRGAQRGAVDKRKRTPLNLAVFNNQLQTARLLHPSGTPFDVLNPILFQAVTGQKISAINLLVELGAKLDVRDKDGRTPIYVAAQKGSKQVAHRLKELGKGEDAKDSSGSGTLLHRAANEEDATATDILIDLKANLEATDNNGQTPLHVASNKMCSEVVALLVAAKANVNAEDTNGKKPLHLAAAYGDDAYETIEKLVKASGIEPSPKDKENRTPLHIAAASSQDRAKIVKLLLDNGATPFKTDRAKQTPLHVAAHNGNNSVLRALLGMREEDGSEDAQGAAPETSSGAGEAQGAPPEASDGAGGAQEDRTAEPVYADIEAQDSSQRTPLHLAALASKRSAVESLLEKSAAKDAIDSYGRTSLHLAAINGEEEIIERLLDPDIEEQKDNGNQIPLAIALANGRREAAALLGQKWEVPDDLVTALVNSNMSDRDTHLARAAASGNQNSAALLLALGANLESTGLGPWGGSAWGGTPLLEAIWNRQPDMVKFLIEKGANRYAYDIHPSYRKSALYWARDHAFLPEVAPHLY